VDLQETRTSLIFLGGMETSTSTQLLLDDELPVGNQPSLYETVSYIITQQGPSVFFFFFFQKQQFANPSTLDPTSQWKESIERIHRTGVSGPLFPLLDGIFLALASQSSKCSEE
jgi:hypothetical protein